LNQPQQPSGVAALKLMTRQPAPIGTVHHRQPRLLAQFDRHENRANMVRDGRANVRCVHLTSPMVRVWKPKPIGCTPIAPWHLRRTDQHVAVAAQARALSTFSFSASKPTAPTTTAGPTT